MDAVIMVGMWIFGGVCGLALSFTSAARTYTRELEWYINAYTKQQTELDSLYFTVARLRREYHNGLHRWHSKNWRLRQLVHRKDAEEKRLIGIINEALKGNRG